MIGAPVSDSWVAHTHFKAGLEDPGLQVGFTQRKKDSMIRIATQVPFPLLSKHL